MGADMEVEAQTYILSPFFEVLVNTLMGAGESAGAHQGFRCAVYEAVSSLVTNSPNDCLMAIQNLTTKTIQALEGTVAMQSQLVGTDDKRAHIEFQANLCSVLTVSILSVNS